LPVEVRSGDDLQSTRPGHERGERDPGADDRAVGFKREDGCILVDRLSQRAGKLEHELGG
jgi:hypothetical protein